MLSPRIDQQRNETPRYETQEDSYQSKTNDLKKNVFVIETTPKRF